MYKPVNNKADFAGQEEQILAFWQQNNIFKKSIINRDNAPNYIMYDGPPFATGLPHYGHLVQSALKDSFGRYQTMRGFKVERRFGWDCHGLPVENEAEKELGLNGKPDIEAYGIAEFNEKCRSVVLKYADEWQNYINRLGRWVDFDNDYKTMDLSYMESIWSVFKELWDKNLVKEGYYILPYCPRCGTILSNHELNMGGYKMVTQQTVTVRFKVDGPANTYLLAWTTTPWTLPSNLALAVGGEVEYVKVKDNKNDEYILAKSRLSHYFKDEGNYQIVWQGMGSELVGLTYQPLFNYFAGLKNDGAFQVRLGHHVSDSDGTGIVHISPGFGEDDYLILKDSGLPVLCPVDGECKFTAEIPDYQGRFVKDCDNDLTKWLDSEGKLFTKESYTHNYPHCWRCEAPLIYRAIGSWFIDVPKIKADMLAANAQIKWIPAHLKEGRFGKWLENARDWAVSRNRFWGNPIPVWTCEAGHRVAIGSVAELEKLSGQKPDDLHKHFVDKITFTCPECGKTMTRISEVFDCWFESGSMPYAQVHYPFEHKDDFTQNFPADFIVEGIDQTRGWFYTLTVIAAALKQSPAFKMVITTGLVLAADGQKMSKSKRNYTDPLEIVHNYGADAVRFYLIASPLTRGEDLRFSDDGVRDVLKSVLIPLWNAYSFFVTYANIDGIKVDKTQENPSHILDSWLLSSLRGLVSELTVYTDNGEVQKSCEAITKFIDNLNNWYIRRSRRRFWKSDNDSDKLQAYSTLHTTLLTLCKLVAPFMPFVSEEIYQNLKPAVAAESVHLTHWPALEDELRNLDLENKMKLTMKTVAMGHSLRNSHNLKNRLPLQRLFLVTRSDKERAILQEMRDIIAEELNIKEIKIMANEENLVNYSAKANFKILGKRLGGDMKAAAVVIEKLSDEQIVALLAGAKLMLSFNGSEITELELTEADIIVTRTEKSNLKASSEGSLTVALDTEITEALRTEGMARDIVRAIQNLRKESGFDIADRITLTIFGSDKVKAAFTGFTELIKAETLTVSANWQQADNLTAVEAGEEEAFIAIKQVAV